jgi:hypothetical protein
MYDSPRGTEPREIRAGDVVYWFGDQIEVGIVARDADGDLRVLWPDGDDDSASRYHDCLVYVGSVPWCGANDADAHQRAAVRRAARGSQR